MLKIQERSRAEDGTFVRFHKEFSLENFDDGYTSKGRFLVYSPNHPRRNRRGYVRRAIVAYEAYYDVIVPPNMDVHHVNGNCLDDSKENLVALAHQKHCKKTQSERSKNALRETKCAHCGKIFFVLKSEPQRFCSQSCYHAHGRSEEHKRRIGEGVRKYNTWMVNQNCVRKHNAWKVKKE